jgi:glycine dehydrogenase subunit 1
VPFIPHTDADRREMLAAIGVASIEELFDEIPRALRAGELTRVPEGRSEMEMLGVMAERAKRDEVDLCLIGAGSYDHHVPAAVWDIAQRGEFLTAYTPYQAEASQGTLQLIYEYQSMMASLCGMEVSNASVYDGGSGLAEAVLMAVRANRKSKSRAVAIPDTVNPRYRRATEDIVRNQNIEVVRVPRDTTGRIDHAALASLETPAALVVQEPNYFGLLEEVDALTDWAADHGVLLIAVVNPTSLALLRPPGRWGRAGADIVCGDGQPLGIPMASGGPSFGFMCCRMEFVRQMPGRIIGRTEDLDGRQGFALTLQAREQHIRRAKATSNICTNQGLLVTAATIYMSLLGPAGLRRVALACHANARRLADALCALPGVRPAFEGAFFHERVLRLPVPAAAVAEGAAARGVLIGYPLGHEYPDLADCLLVCATEKHGEDAAARAVAVLADVLGAGGTS